MDLQPPDTYNAFKFIGNGTDPIVIKADRIDVDGLVTIKETIDPFTKIVFEDDNTVFLNEHWLKVDTHTYNYLHKMSAHPRWSPQQQFEKRVEAYFDPQPQVAVLKEGQVLNISKLISDAIKIPQGDYIIALIDSDSNKCVLVPTSEAGGATFEVFKPTLTGFFNAEIHKKTVTKSTNPIITERS